MQFLRRQPISMACPPQPWALVEQKASCLKLLFAHTCSSSLELSFLLQSSWVRPRHPKASLTPWESPAQGTGSYIHVHLEGVSLGQGGSGPQAQAGHPFGGTHVSGAAQGPVSRLNLKLMSCLWDKSHRRCGIWGLEGRVPTPNEGEIPAKRDVPLAIRWRQISAPSLAARSAALEDILQLGASGRVWHVPGCKVIQIQTQFWASWSYGTL